MNGFTMSVGETSASNPVQQQLSSDLDISVSEEDTSTNESTDIFADVTVTDLGSELEIGLTVRELNSLMTHPSVAVGNRPKNVAEASVSGESKSEPSNPRKYFQQGEKADSCRSDSIDDFQKVDFNQLWYQGSEYNRFWRHYHAVGGWCRQHVTVMKSLLKTYGHLFEPHLYTFPKNVLGYPVPRCWNIDAMPKRKRKRSKRHSRARRRSYRSSGSADKSNHYIQGGTDSVTETSAKETQEEYEMEITEEMLEFFASSEKFRLERDAGKLAESHSAEKIQEDTHINLENEFDMTAKATEAAPTQRPGQLRTKQMQMLYGKGSAMIHGMETALQMSYDRNFDIHQPKMWPNIPLRIQLK